MAERLSGHSFIGRHRLEPGELDALAAAVAEKVAERMITALDDRPLLSSQELAARLNIGLRTAKELLYPLKDPAIPSFLVGGARRIAPADVDRYVAAQRNGTD